jgi:hypothetical protein
METAQYVETPVSQWRYVFYYLPEEVTTTHVDRESIIVNQLVHINDPLSSNDHVVVLNHA